MKFKAIMTTLCIATATPSMAVAQDMGAEEVQAPSVVDPIRLQLAEQIIATAYPDEFIEPMFMTVVDQMAAQTRQSLAGTIDNPEAQVVVDKWQDDTLAGQKEILRSHIPRLMTAWAKSYAVMFTEPELTEILAFVSTPSGRTFMRKSSQIMGETHFADANQAYLDEIVLDVQAKMPALMESLIELGDN